jgi:AraC-like DNA-binding protein
VLNSAATVTSVVPWAIIQAVRALGVEAAPLFRLIGLAEDRPPAVEVHIPADGYHELWGRVMRELDDPAFPIRMGSVLQLEDSEVFGFLAMSCQTMGEAYQRTARYRALFNVGARWELESAAGATRLLYYPWVGDRRDVGVRCAAEFAVADMYSAIVQLAATRVTLREVRFAHAAPADTRTHLELFGVQPTFGAPLDELVFATGLEGIAVRTFNSRLRDYFEAQCALLAEQFAGDAPITTRVRAELIAAMDGGDPSMENIARRIGTSGRSLHRRLSEEGTRFNDLLDTVRQEFAKRYLARKSVSASEVAYLIGFQSPTAFFRAFKRWTGRTPSQFLAAPSSG